ncbi:vitelline membrane protein Vm26Ab-like [Aedes albopictus]|uniref:Secreted protein n=1 Tax=Aedes albopictus TaxID=7160 RepID=A0ABM1Y4N7_AEDAL|nr:vitelline membrane protein Vm26Ab-like [Aedes albopictus]
MAFFKVSCLVVLMTVGVALSAVLKSENLESAEQKDDLEGAETIFLGKKLLLLKGLGLGGLALSASQNGGGLGGFGGKFSGLIGGGPNSVDYAGYAPSYSGSYVAAPAPAPVVYSAPAPVTYSAPAPVTYSAPAPVTYSAPAPVTYQAPLPAPVAYSAPAPVADVPVSSGYTGSLQVVGYLQPVQPVQPVAYTSQVSTGLYSAPPPPAPLPLAPLPPCDH